MSSFSGSTAQLAGIAWWQRALVVLAALAAVAAATWAIVESATVMLIVYTPWPLIALAPVLAREMRTFRRACLLAGSCLVIFGALGTFAGLFVFIPAGVAVLAAATTVGRIAWLGGSISTLIGAASLAYAIGQVVPLFSPPDAFVVQFDATQYRENTQVLDQLAINPPRFERGATEVSVGADNAGPEWTVFFRSDLSPNGQASLRAYLGKLPAVAGVRLCGSPTECGR
jgi:hypothetical protein